MVDAKEVPGINYKLQYTHVHVHICVVWMNTIPSSQDWSPVSQTRQPPSKPADR